MAPEIVERTAPGKIILCGEHSVVYGRPAIAVPVSDMCARARVEPASEGSGLRIRAIDLRRELHLSDNRFEDPLDKVARLVLEHLDVAEPDAILTLRSDLPIASGMGSGAAVSAAAARALATYLGHELSPEVVSALTYEVEKIHHGTPSGIDNTVIAWEKPVYFVKGQPPEVFDIHTSFTLVIANSGIASSTREAVREVRHRWTATPSYYDVIFNCIGAIARAARAAVEQGALRALGTLLDENHELLKKMGVSLPQLDALVQSAREAGAFGAKLTGSGQGGNIIALVAPETLDRVKTAVVKAGAVKVWQTSVT
ncbi:MAG: mevalonate kinase [Anaerolineae bacterium]